MRLKQKIILVNAIVFSILITVSVSLNFFYTADVFVTSINSKNQLKTDLIALNVDEWFIKQVYVIYHIINTLIYTKIRKKDEIEHFLKHLNTKYPDDVFAVFYETGMFVNGHNWEQPEGYNPREREWYIKAKDQKKAVITQPYMSLNTKPSTMAFSISKQFIADEGLSGVVVLEIKLASLFSLIDKFKKENGSYAFLFDNDNNIISHPSVAYNTNEDKLIKFQNLEGGTNILNYLSKPTPSFENKNISHITDYDGMNRIFYFSKAKTCTWNVGYAICASELYSPLSGLRIRAILLCLLLVITVVLLSKAIAKKLSRPIELISQTMEKAAKNNEPLNFDFPDGRKTYELERIAKSFNTVINNMAMAEGGGSSSEITFCGNALGLTERIHKFVCTMGDNDELYLLYLDIDKFKTINQLFGYYAGNALIKHVFEIIEHNLQKCDITKNNFMHVMGDEFAIFYNGSKHDACNFASYLIDVVSKSNFIWNDKELTISLSIGIVDISKTNTNEQDVLASVYEACEIAFKTGGNCYKFLSHNQNAFSRGNVAFWINTIQRALKEDWFVLYKQAIMPLNNHLTSQKYEILLRLKDHDGNIIMPDQFIPIAEQYNMIYEIDKWVIKNSFIHFAKLLKMNNGESKIMFSINISADSFFSNDIVEFICKNKEEYGVPSNNFCFEITESCAVRNLEATSKFVTELRKQGFSFALDDFGKGFSSFPYLKTLPIDYVKIDGSFIKSIDKDYVDFSMVKTMRDMCHHLGLYTIGEYAENNKIVSILKDIGIDYGQGYAFQKPIPISENMEENL